MSRKIRVVIADDSAFMRKRIREIIESDPELEVVAAARNGQDAVEQVEQHDPHVVTLDINMPVMDGITALQTIMSKSPRPVLMISSLTQEGALTTFECLELGAVDFIGKISGTISTDIHIQSADIIAKIKSAARAKIGGPLPHPRPPIRGGGLRRGYGKPPQEEVGGGEADRIVVIGVSTGGPRTLMEILPYLPASLDAAIVVVQHMPEGFTATFAERLNDACVFPIKEGASGDILMKGHGYVAHGGKHLVFTRRVLGGGVMARCVMQPSNVPHIPSVDVTMQSAVSVFGSRIVGVLLTGMGADGADGMVAIRRAGGSTIAEAEETCIVFGMPAQAIARGGAEHVLPCQMIANKITELVAGAVGAGT